MTMEEAFACQRLVSQLKSIHGTARTLRIMTSNRYLKHVAVSALLNDTDCVSQLLSFVRESPGDVNARQFVLEVLASAPLSQAAHRNGAALKTCLELLKEENTPSVLLPHIRNLATSRTHACDDEQRRTCFTDLCLSLGEGSGAMAAANARALARLAGRRELPASSSYSLHHEPQYYGVIGPFIETNATVIPALVHTLAVAPASVASDVAVLLGCIMYSRVQYMDYSLLIDAQVVPVLIDRMQKDESAIFYIEALVFMARADRGQEELIQANALPTLMSIIDAAEQDADSDRSLTMACMASFVIGQLAYHPDGREAIKGLVERAFSSKFGFLVVAHCGASNFSGAGCRALLEQSTLPVICMAVSAGSALQMGWLTCIEAVMRHGELAEYTQLLDAGAVSAVIQTLSENIDQPLAWSALRCMIEEAEAGRAQALNHAIMELIAAALTTGGVNLKYQVLGTITALLGSKRGAEAIADDAAIIPLVVAMISEHISGSEAHYLALKATVVLNEVLERQIGTRAEKVLEEVALLAWENTLKLYETDHVDFGKPRKGMSVLRTKLAKSQYALSHVQSALDELAGLKHQVKLQSPLRSHSERAKPPSDSLSTGPRSKTEGSIPSTGEVLISGSEDRVESARMLAAHGLLHACFSRVEGEQDLSMKLVHVLHDFPALPAAEQIAVLDVLANLPLEEKKRLVRDSELVDLLIQMIRADSSPQILWVSKLLGSLAGAVPAVAKIAVQAVPSIVGHLQSASECQSTLKKRLTVLANTILDQAEQAGEGDGLAMVNEFCSPGAVQILLSQISSDKLCELKHSQQCCQILGRLSIVEPGKAAVAQLVAESSICVMPHLLKTVHGRAAAVEAQVLGKLHEHFSRFAQCTAAEKTAVLDCIYTLAQAQATVGSILPLVPSIITTLNVSSLCTVTTVIQKAVSIIETISKQGSEGLMALRAAGVFSSLLPLMRTGQRTGNPSLMARCTTVLHNAIVDSDTSAEFGIALESLLSLLPETMSVDMLEASDPRFVIEAVKRLAPLNNMTPKVAKAKGWLSQHPRLVPTLLAGLAEGSWALHRTLAKGCSSCLLGLLAHSDAMDKVLHAGGIKLLVKGLSGAGKRAGSVLAPLQKCAM